MFTFVNYRVFYRIFTFVKLYKISDYSTYVKYHICCIAFLSHCKFTSVFVFEFLFSCYNINIIY